MRGTHKCPLNSLDYLIDENGLSEAKGKEYIVRLLDTKKVNDEKMYWQMLNILSPILLMGLFTFIINWIKKRQNIIIQIIQVKANEWMIHM